MQLGRRGKNCVALSLGDAWAAEEYLLPLLGFEPPILVVWSAA